MPAVSSVRVVLARAVVLDRLYEATADGSQLVHHGRVCARAERLPLADRSVESVLLAQSWHWFYNERALAAARRVIRPGGWLALEGRRW